jgi:ethanolamine ammonia-lyase large subunit
MGVPSGDDVMLNYQSTSFDAALARRLFNLRPAPEFAAWLESRGIFQDGQLARQLPSAPQGLLRQVAALLS